MLLLNNVAVTDTYDDPAAAALGPIPNARTIFFVVANASVGVQWKPAGIPEPPWADEILVTPSVSNTLRGAQAVRFRNAKAGSVARVVAALFSPSDPEFQGGTAFAGTLDAQGGVTTGVNLPTGATLPASPNDGDGFVWIPDGTNFPDVHWLMQWNAGTGFWDFLSGAPMISYVPADEGNPGGANNVFFDLPTVGPQITTPANNGDWDLVIQCLSAVAGNPYMAVKAGASATIKEDGSGCAGTAAVYNGISRPSMRRTVPASTILKAQYLTTNNIATAKWKERTLALTPFRVSP